MLYYDYSISSTDNENITFSLARLAFWFLVSPFYLFHLCRFAITYIAKVKAKPKQKVRRGRGKTSARPTPAGSPELETESGACTRSGENEEIKGWSWEQVLCSDPEMLIRQASRMSESEDESPLAAQHRLADEKRQAESLINPTEAMTTIMKKMEERERERQHMSWQQQLQQLQQNKKGGNNKTVWDLTPNPLTPAMEEVINMRSQRVSFDYDVPITPEPSDSEEDDDEVNATDDRALEAGSDSSHEEYLPEEAPPAKISNELRLSPRRPSPAKQQRDSIFGSDIESQLGGREIDLDEELIRILKEEGVSIAQQRQELKRYNDKISRRQPRLASTSVQQRDASIPDETDKPQPSTSKQQPKMVGTSNRISEDISSSSSSDWSDGEDPSQYHYPDKEVPLLPPARRISIQNDASPIRNKDSPPDGIPMSEMLAASDSKPVLMPLILTLKKKKKASKETWVVGRKRRHPEDDSEADLFPKREKVVEDAETEVAKEAPLPCSPAKTRSRTANHANINNNDNSKDKLANGTKGKEEIAAKPKPAKRKKTLSAELRSLLESAHTTRSRVESRRPSDDNNSKPRRKVANRNFGFLADPEKIMKRKK